MQSCVLPPTQLGTNISACISINEDSIWICVTRPNDNNKLE